VSQREETAPAGNGGRQVETGERTQAITLSEAGPVSNELATLEQKLAAYDPRKFNVLTPVVTFGDAPLARHLAPVVMVVQIRAEAGHTYQSRAFHKGDEQALSAGGLAFLSKIANVEWGEEGYSRQADYEQYPGELAGRPFTHVRIQWEAKAGIRLPNGAWFWQPKSKTIDTGLLAEAMADEDLASIKKGWNKGWVEADIPERVRRRILQVRENIESLAETKAQNRVLRPLLGVQSKYTNTELAHPFVVPVFQEDPESIPITERVARGHRAAEQLYGSGPALPSGSREERSEEPDGSGERDGVERAAGEASSGTPLSGSDETDASTGPAAAPPSEPIEWPEVTNPIKPLGQDDPNKPKEDPELTDGPHKGKRMSEVASIDLSHLEAIAAMGRTKAIRERAQAWIDYSRPRLT
jgi:hypothetical protein